MNWMRALHHLRHVVARNAFRLIPSEPLGRDDPLPAPPTDAAHTRLHFFGAEFPTRSAAEAFCFRSKGPDLPVPLTQELTGAFIDLNEVEVVFGGIAQRLGEFMNPAEVEDVVLRLEGNNTLIILTEDAFGGLPYDLDDTEWLTYLGAWIVDI